MTDDDDSPRIWTGTGRRDCDPDRRLELRVLALAGVLLGMVSLGLGVTALLGLPAAVTALALARHDLGWMEAQLMDLAGQPATEHARDLGVAGVLLNAGGIVIGALMVGNHLLP
jgi:hypothetical protein